MPDNQKNIKYCILKLKAAVIRMKTTVLRTKAPVRKYEDCKVYLPSSLAQKTITLK